MIRYTLNFIVLFIIYGLFFNWYVNKFIITPDINKTVLFLVLSFSFILSFSKSNFKKLLPLILGFIPIIVIAIINASISFINFLSSIISLNSINKIIIDKTILTYFDIILLGFFYLGLLINSIGVACGDDFEWE